MQGTSIIAYLLSLVLAPLALGVINRVKAVFAGRRGQPLLQAYSDVFKLLRKGAVYSSTTTWVFRAGPAVSLGAVLVSLTMVPWGGVPALLAFDGDILVFVYVLAVARFFIVIAAMDTGSAFEGMGASREVLFSAIAEPALLVGLVTLARLAGGWSLSTVLPGVSVATWSMAGASLALLCLAWMIVFLAENARIPVDDPNTHLELTMIHEVMVLDHSGPDFGCILYGSSLKLWTLGALLANVLVPVRSGSAIIDISATIGGVFALAVVTGIVESTMARLRLLRVPHLIAAAGALSVLSLVLLVR
jgi:formate hydrogenlyase subunit 4